MSFGCLQEAAIGGGDALLPESDGHRLEGEFPGGQWAIPTGQAGRGSKLGRAVIPRAETPVGLTAPSVGKILSKERRPIALPRFSERFTTQERPQHISLVQSVVSGVRGTWAQIPIPAFTGCIQQ